MYSFSFQKAPCLNIIYLRVLKQLTVQIYFARSKKAPGLVVFLVKSYWKKLSEIESFFRNSRLCSEAFYWHFYEIFFFLFQEGHLFGKLFSGLFELFCENFFKDFSKASLKSFFLESFMFFSELYLAFFESFLMLFFWKIVLTLCCMSFSGALFWSFLFEILKAFSASLFWSLFSELWSRSFIEGFYSLITFS